MGGAELILRALGGDKATSPLRSQRFMVRNSLLWHSPEGPVGLNPVQQSLSLPSPAWKGPGGGARETVGGICRRRPSSSRPAVQLREQMDEAAAHLGDSLPAVRRDAD